MANQRSDDPSTHDQISIKELNGNSKYSRSPPVGWWANFSVDGRALS
jgi:hypothetical protein